MKRRILFFLIFAQNLFASLESLQEKYSWPQSKPSVKSDNQSMFSNDKQLKQVLNNRMKLIIELGSWLGSSTRFILDQSPKATVIAIDHWKGSSEHQKKPHYQNKLEHLYETFLVNCWHYKHRLIPMKTTTQEGLREIADAGLMPDLIYIDAAHDFDSVLADISLSYKLFPNAILTGDDWSWTSVRQAVEYFAQHNNMNVVASRNFWQLTPK
jgi:hypothetical protein